MSIAVGLWSEDEEKPMHAINNQSWFDSHVLTELFCKDFSSVFGTNIVDNLVTFTSPRYMSFSFWCAVCFCFCSMIPSLYNSMLKEGVDFSQGEQVKGL